MRLPLRYAILSPAMNFPSIHPPNIGPGGIIRIVAPGGTIEDRSSLERGISTLERMGFRVQYDERIFDSFRYLAGDDRARAEELMAAFEDPAVHAVMALRGGYGCSRLIPLLEEERLRHHPKPFIGFSDITTLHLYFQKRFGWITIHGPMAATATLGSMPYDQEQHLLSLLSDPGYLPVLQFTQLEAWHPGTAEGRLTGGCLSIVAASIGTPYEIETDGKILFLEDCGEPPYRIDRMVTHLRLAGKFRSVSGILLGTFLDCEPDKGEYRSADVLRELLGEPGVPVIASFPAGHGFENWAVPLGTRVQMDADTRSVRLLEAAVAVRT